MKQFRTLTKFTFRVLLAITLVSISGCLVDEDSVATIKTRAPGDFFRQIESGDFYDYIVQGQITPSGGGTPSSFTGTLNVTYTQTTLPTPFAVGTPILVLREDSTLILGGSTFLLKRYIQQDSNGAISILAVRSGVIGSDIGTLYRTSLDDNLNTTHPIEILPSPVPSTSASNQTNFSYRYMSGCEPVTSACASVVQTTNEITIRYQGDADITTNEGRFQALRIDYDSQFLGIAAPLLFDLRGACDINTALFFGSTYVFPEVGIVFMENSCTSIAGGGHRYTASLVNTNVTIP